MAYKVFNSKTFKVNKNIEIKCQAQDTSYGFRHLAEIYLKDRFIGFAKCTYYNRTWERYEFESVLKKLSLDFLSDSQQKTVKRYIKNYDRVKDDLKPLRTISSVMALGDLFGTSQKEANDWKTHMLKVGLEGKGLIMPEDWNELDEATKEARLNGAIKALK